MIRHADGRTQRESPGLLVIDVGNTSTVLGWVQRRRISRVVRVATHVQDPYRVFGQAVHALLGRHKIDGAVLCSVVPEVNRFWNSVLRHTHATTPLFVTAALRFGIEVDYPRPQTIGSDRLVNACAAAHRYGHPVIVADFGTATTFDVVSARGAFVGGVIAPGLPLMADYLSDRTALLPRIGMRGRFGAIGRSTVEAMRIGAHIGYRGLVREIVAYLLSGMRQNRKVKLVATGGYARQALRGAQLAVDLCPRLTLEGLVHVYDLNS